MIQLFSGKNGLITGAASGISRAAALACVREGDVVGALDQDAQGLKDTVDMVKSRSGRAHGIEADVSDASGMKHAVESVVASFGKLDCVDGNYPTL